MNLNDFEDYIFDLIVERGYVYYEDGCVTSIQEKASNCYVAEVMGSRHYNVTVKLDKALNIIGTQCDCPYDKGEYCKHQVAVFLAVRHLRNRNHCNATVKQAPDLKDILSKRTKDELIELLLKAASEHDEIRRRIELHYDVADDADEIDKSSNLIRSYIDAISDSDGYVSFNDVGEAVQGADLVLEKASIARDRGKPAHAIDLILCVIHEMMVLLIGCDDSDGTVSGIIEESISLISEIVSIIVEEEQLGPEDKEKIFNKLEKEASHKRYDGWEDWRLELLNICAELTVFPPLRDRLENHLAAVLEDGEEEPWSCSYITEDVNLIRYNMILKYDGLQKAQEFIQQNLQFPGFRKLAIENAMQNEDYNLAIDLAADGEEQDKDWRGRAFDWKKYRYKAYQLSGRLAEQRELATDFILNDRSFDHYIDLKETYPPGEWQAIYSEIVARLEASKYACSGVYTRILISEGEQQKLLEFVKGQPSTIETYYIHLIPEFKEEAYNVFLQHIERTAAMAGSRREYQRVCAVIRNLKKAGGNDEALVIKHQLLNRYSNKPAFKDELSKV